MLTAAKATLAEAHSDVLVYKGLLSAAVRRARERVREVVEILIARGGTAVAIKKARRGPTVAEVPITGIEMIRAFGEATHYGRRIAAGAFPSMIMGIDFLGPILDVESTYYSIESEFKVESRVIQVFQEKAGVIIGGVIIVEASRKDHPAS